MATYRKNKYVQDWVPEKHYHLYNHAVHLNDCFLSPEDYLTFIALLGSRFRFFCEIYAFCLIPNHFHIAVRLKSVWELIEGVQLMPNEFRGLNDAKFLRREMSYTAYVGQLAGAAMNSYTGYFNSKTNRKGPLMFRPIRRVETTNLGFSRGLVCYVDLNFAKHHLGKATDSYPYTSLGKQYEFINYDELYAGFGGKQAYITYHKTYMANFGQSFINFDEESFFGIK